MQRSLSECQLRAGPHRQAPLAIPPFVPSTTQVLLLRPPGMESLSAQEAVTQPSPTAPVLLAPGAPRGLARAQGAGGGEWKAVRPASVPRAEATRLASVPEHRQVQGAWPGQAGHWELMGMGVGLEVLALRWSASFSGQGQGSRVPVSASRASTGHPLCSGRGVRWGRGTARSRALGDCGQTQVPKVGGG